VKILTLSQQRLEISILFLFCAIHVGARILQLVWWLAVGWMVQGSKPNTGEMFRTHPYHPWGPPSLLYNGFWVFSGGKVARVWQPPMPCSDKVKERVELYICSPSGPSLPVQGWTLPLFYLLLCVCVFVGTSHVRLWVLLNRHFVVWCSIRFYVTLCKREIFNIPSE